MNIKIEDVKIKKDEFAKKYPKYTLLLSSINEYDFISNDYKNKKISDLILDKTFKEEYIDYILDKKINITLFDHIIKQRGSYIYIKVSSEEEDLQTKQFLHNHGITWNSRDAIFDLTYRQNYSSGNAGYTLDIMHMSIGTGLWSGKTYTLSELMQEI